MLKKFMLRRTGRVIMRRGEKANSPPIEKASSMFAKVVLALALAISTFPESNRIDKPERNRSARGYTVLSTTDLLQVAGRGKDGRIYRAPVDRALEGLDPLTALQIYQRCTPVFAVVSNRARRIASTDWHVESIKKSWEPLADNLLQLKEVFEENDSGVHGLSVRLRILPEIRRELPEVFPDLSNFHSCFRRWIKRCKQANDDRTNEIEDFLNRPFPGLSWEEWVTQLVVDLHVHGRAAVYKVRNDVGQLDRLKVLPGGSVSRITPKFASEDFPAFVQFPDGQLLYGEEPQVFFPDEIAYTEFLPNSSMGQGMSPLDSLVTLVSETMLFDRLMAESSDGTRPPDKLVVFGDRNPGLDPADFGEFSDDTLDVDEQRRIETKLNRPTRDAAVATLTGYGHPLVLDLSRADEMPARIQRQNQIKNLVGLALGATPIELNEAGGDATSGRSTAESQERIELGRSVQPTFRNLQAFITHEILPDRYGPGYRHVFETSRTPFDTIRLAREQAATGIFSINEIREEIGRDAWPEAEFDRPLQKTAGEEIANSLGNLAQNII